MKPLFAALSLIAALVPSVAFAQWTPPAGDGSTHYDNGNVGIGTGPNPPARFVVAGSGAERFRVNADGRIVAGSGPQPVDTGQYPMTMTLNTGAFNYFRIVGGGTPSLAGIIYDLNGSSSGYLEGFNNYGTFRIVPIGTMGQTGITEAKDGQEGISLDSLARVGVGRLPTSDLGLYATRLTVGGASTYNYVRLVGGGVPSLAGVILDRTGNPDSTGYLTGFDNDGRLRIAPVGTMDQAGVTNAKDGVIVTEGGQQVTRRAGLTLTTDGRLGIGKAPGAGTGELLYVAGAVTVDGNIGAKYQDVAEWVVSDEDIEPGTVVVLSRRGDDRVTPSSRAYDTAVAGVVSEIPGIILGERGAGKEQIATTGRVKVKVDATAGPIAIGDLLVTSDKPGLAMKSVPLELQGRRLHQPGTILGKALQPLESGTGTILVLLSLQ